MQKLHSNFRCLSRSLAQKKCDDDVSLHFNAFFLPVQLNPLDAVLHIHNIAEKENIDVEKNASMFTQNAYLLYFLERDIYHRCTRVSHERAQRHVKLM